MFAIWQGTVRAGRVTEPVHDRHPGQRPQRRRLPGLGQRRGPDLRAGRDRRACPRARVRRGQPGADRVRPDATPARSAATRRWPSASSTCSSASSRYRATALGRRPASYSSAGGRSGSRCLATRAVGRARQRVELLPEARHLERGQPLRRPRRAARRSRRAPGRGTTNALISSSDSSDGTPTTAHSTHGGMRGDRLLDLERRQVLAAPAQHLLLAGDEGVDAVGVAR